MVLPGPRASALTPPSSASEREGASGRESGWASAVSARVPLEPRSVPSFLFSLNSALYLFPPQRHPVSPTPALCLLRRLKLGFSTRVFPRRRLGSAYCLQELGGLFFLSSFNLHLGFGHTSLPRTHTPFPLGSGSSLPHSGGDFLSTFQFLPLDGEIMIVAISLLALQPLAPCLTGSL